MANTEIIQNIKRGYEMWSEGDENAVPYFLSLLSEDITWKSPASDFDGAAFTTARNSPAEVVQYFTDIAKEWEMQHFTVDEFVAERDRLVMIGRCAFKHRVTGKLVETDKVDVFRLRDNKVSEFTEFFDSYLMSCATCSD